MKIFHLPDLGEGLAEAEIREWYVKVGDAVTVDQPLLSMETAKAVVDVPSPYAGKIIRLHGKQNEMIQTGSALVTFEVEGSVQDQGSVVGKLESSESKWHEGDVIIGAPKVKNPSVKAMPAARVLAQQMQIDLSSITGTGPQGLITPDDVKNYSSHTTQLPGETESLHGVRRAMAVLMAQSHREVVPVTLVDDIDVTALPEKTDITARLLQAIVIAAKAEPALNAWFDGKALQRKLFNEIHIGLAMDTPDGLFVPVIKNAEEKSLTQLRQAIDAYKKSVRDRSISPADMQGATITLSNFGTMSGRYATPIVVPPMVSIVGCGKIRDVPLVRDGKVVAGRVIPISLTFDHRAMTGGEATRFLGALIQAMQLS